MINLHISLPFVILIDLDNTIQGDIEPQLEESNLHHLINLHNESAPKIKPDKKRLCKDFSKGLLRPGFKRFIKRMTEKFPNVEFFVYTASNNEWGKYLVKQIETVVGIQFNKRVFTRNDCIFDSDRNVYYKSIRKVTPDIFTNLKKKYGLIGNKTKYAFKHIIMIDNNEVLRNEETQYLVKCPNYHFKVVIDPFRSISDEVIKRNYKMISKYLLKYECTNVFRFYSDVYAMMEKRYLKAAFVNSNDDNYWDIQMKRFKRDYQVV